MSRKIALGPVTALLLLLVAHSTALAQDEKDPVARYEEAIKLAESGRLGEAVLIWEELVDKLEGEHLALVHFRLGAGYKKYGKLAESWHHLRTHLDMAETSAPEAAETLQHVEEALARRHVMVVIQTVPKGGKVFPTAGEGTPGYPTPLTWWFKPGTRRVRVEKEGFGTHVEEFTISAVGDLQMVTCKLAQVAKLGKLEIKGPEVGAQVLVNGQVRGTIPLALELEAGTYDVEVTRPGRRKWRRTITLNAGSESVQRPVLPKPTVVTNSKPGGKVTVPDWAKAKRSARWKWGWGLAGGGAGMAVVGGILQAAAYSKNERLHEDYPPGSAEEGQYVDGYEGSVKPMSTAAYVLYGLGGATAAVGVVLLVVDATRKEKSTVIKHVTMAPQPLPEGFGAVMAFEF